MENETRTLLIELPEECWRMAEVFAAAQPAQPYSVGKIIEMAIQAGLGAQMGLLAVLSPQVAQEVAIASLTKEGSQKFIKEKLCKEGGDHEHKS